MKDLEISVVIPVYNAATFLKEAVESVIQQPEVKEVFLVDDGSVDGSQDLAAALAATYPGVYCLSHPGNQNKGVGATRNIGIAAATSKWIAFLDADDIWLPHRFEKTKQVLQEHQDADGVYECLGIRFESEEAKAAWYRRFRHTHTTLSANIEPKALIFRMAPLGKEGWFSGDALLVKKSLLQDCGGFSDLRMSQDTELFMKLAMKGKLYPGNIEHPVAERRVHESNRITSSSLVFYTYRCKLFRQVFDWCVEEKISSRILLKVWTSWIRCMFVLFRLYPVKQGIPVLVSETALWLSPRRMWGIWLSLLRPER